RFNDAFHRRVVPISYGLEFAWRITDAPFVHFKRIDLEAAGGCAVYEQLNRIAIGICDDAHQLTIATGPGPVREQVHERLGREPRLVQIERIFGESAGVHDPEMRIHARPAVRRGLAAIVEPRPNEEPRDELAV